MTHKRAVLMLVLLTALAVAACNGQTPAPAVDVDAAVADRAGRHACRGAAGGSGRPGNAHRQRAPAATVASTPTAAPADTLPAPTATSAAPGATPAPPTATAPPPTVAPTPTPLRIAESDVDGNDGNDFLRGSSNSNNGRVVLLPGFDQAAAG